MEAVYPARWSIGLSGSLLELMKRPIVLFPPAALVTLLTWSMGVGCASDEAARLEAARAAREARHGQVQQATYAEDGSPEMTVEGEEGTLNATDVDGALHEHFGELRDCYRQGRRTGGLRAFGQVVLRFFVDGRGEVTDVAIIKSSIGNHAVERCLADIGLGVVFERPAGNKPTTFDYPVEFRPARPLTAARERK
jgi:TonB family protein